MMTGPILAGLGAALLILSAVYALYDAGRVHFLRRAEVEGRTRMKIWPLWAGIAGAIPLLLSTWFR
jgi:hypothetical protein